MHLYFFVRGIIPQVEVFKAMAQSQFWKWTRIDAKTGKDATTLVQGALRPTILGAYEYIIPEECLAEALAIFGITRERTNSFKLNFLRKMLGFEKVPNDILIEAENLIKTGAISMVINKSMRGLSHCIIPGVDIHFFGIKRDEKGEMYGFIQEGL